MARDYRIDSIKGLLIILVVIGHVILALDNANVINHGVMGLIYMFHMPLFILISGYLTKSPGKQPAGKMWKGVLEIFITLVIFQLLSAVRVYFYGGDFVKALEAFPFGVLWYLLSLIYWRILLYYSPRWLLQRPAVYLGIALVVSVLCGLTHLGKPLSLQRTMNFYVFFLLGYYYRQGMLPSQWWHNNWLHGAVCLVLLPVIFWLYPHCGNVMNGADHYGLPGIPQKVLILTCSIAMTLLVFNMMRDVTWLRPIGRDSLFYYLYHIFFISGVIEPLGKLHRWPTSFPFILLYSAAVMAVLLLMSKVGFFKWLMHPTFKKSSPGKPSN